MSEVSETQLPGVGVRHEFTTADGERVGVLVHRSGRRELLVYDKADPDACGPPLRLSSGDARTLAELLGATQVSEAVSAVQQQIEGLAIDWLPIEAGSPVIGSSIADGDFRAKTGASIVAVVRGSTTHPAPEPGFTFDADDVVVAVGTSEGLADLRSLLRD
jgi:TrkA domain protein